MSQASPGRAAGAPDVAVRAAMAATKTIPIVFVTASDPVGAGFVPSLGRSATPLRRQQE